jgi:hypothetical protein
VGACGFGSHSREEKGLTFGDCGHLQVATHEGSRWLIEQIRANFRYRHAAGTTMGTLATVVFWMALVWVPGLVLMPPRHH